MVGCTVNDPAKYRRALRHRSVLRGSEDSRYSNERLEFLGDAIVGMVVAEYLFLHFPTANEGFLTKLRSKLVNGRSLADCARRIHLGDELELSANMDRAEGRDNASILSDAYEAFVGAIYRDLGLPPAKEFVERTLLEPADLEHLAERHDNYKSLLLEMAQARSWPQPRYDVIHEEGPDHDKTFTVQVTINDRRLGTGTAGSKKQAEQIAAGEALAALEDDVDDGSSE